MAKTIAQLEAEKKANSSAWHGAASQADKDALHLANQNLQKQIDSYSGGSSSFNSNSGTWTSTPGAGSVSQPPQAPSYTYSAPKTDANGQIDIGTQINDAISGGKDYQYVQELLNQRYDKINSSGGQLGQYKNDNTSLAAQEYIRQGENGRVDRERSDREAQIAAQNQAALDAYLDQITGSLGGQKRGVEQDAETLAREAYLSYMQSMRTAPQALSAAGFSGGMADSQLAGLQANLQNNQNKIQDNKNSAIYGIDQAITDAQLQASMEAARQKADMGMASLDAWNNFISQEKQFDYGREQMANENAWREKEFGSSQLQNQYNLDKEKAVTLAGSGNFSALAKLWGLSDVETATLVNDYAQQKQVSAAQAAWDLAERKGQYGDLGGLKDLGVNVNMGALKSSSGGGSGGSTGGVVKPRLSQSAVTAAIDKDMITPEVISGFEYYYGIPFDEYYKKQDSAPKLGVAAQGIANNLSRSYGDVGAKGQIIMAAKANGSITEAEAQYLLDAIGAPNES